MRYRISKTAAMLLTFLLSACAHELVMVVVTRKFRYILSSFTYIYMNRFFRMYLFVMQVSFCAARLKGALPEFLPLCSDRPNSNDHAESRTSHQTK